MVQNFGVKVGNTKLLGAGVPQFVGEWGRGGQSKYWGLAGSI